MRLQHCRGRKKGDRHPLAGLLRLARVHLHHHRTDVMTHSNFNITFPVFDWILGTLHDEA